MLYCIITWLYIFFFVNPTASTFKKRRINASLLLCGSDFCLSDKKRIGMREGCEVVIRRGLYKKGAHRPP